MATELEIQADHQPGYYDRATEKSCQAEKVIDITEDSPSIEEGARAILVYTRDSRRRLVEARIIDRDAKSDTGTLAVLVSVDDPASYVNERTGLDYLVTLLGLTKLQLSEIISENAPH